MQLIKRYKEREFDIVEIPYIYRRCRGPKGGHTKLFGTNVYGYNISSDYGWADKVYWAFIGLVALSYIDTQNGKLKSVKPQGYYWTFCKFKFKAAFHKADLYRS